MVNKLFPLPSGRGSKWGKKDLQSLDGVQRERQWCKLKVNVEQKSIRFAICNLMMALGARSPQCQHTWNLWYWSSSLTFHVKCRRQVLFVLSHINVITTFMFFSSQILEDCLKYYMKWGATNNQLWKAWCTNTIVIVCLWLVMIDDGDWYHLLGEEYTSCILLELWLMMVNYWF